MPESPPKPRKLSISRKLLLGVGFTLVMLALIAMISFMSTRRFLTTTAQVSQTREIIERTERVQRYFLDMESGVRGFLLSGDETYLGSFINGQSFIVEELKTLLKLTADHGEQQARILRVQSLVSSAFAVHGALIDRQRDGGITAVAEHFTDPENKAEAKQIFGSIQDELGEFDQAERVRMREQGEELEGIGSVNISLVIGGTTLTYIALLVACLFILRDIAERRRAEDALAMERNLLGSIMDTIPDFIFVKDTEGLFLRANPNHRRHLGLGLEETITGKSVYDFYPPDLAELYAADDRAVLRLGQPQLDKVEFSRSSTGRGVWLETTKVPLRDTNGKLLGIVGLSSDITQRREKDEKLQHYAEALKKSNDELQNFASVASHDLQEPLRKIQAFGDRLQVRHARQLDDQARDFLARMMDAASRMQTLIEDLLKLSRVTTRALPFERCDLQEIARGVLADLEVKIAASGAKVHVGALPTIDGDPTQLRQLLQNLIANALKFQRPDGRPEVWVSSRILLNAEGLLREVPLLTEVCELRVRDNGIGFEPRFAEQIFGPFKRLHARTEYEGSGIGLSVCRKITDRHRGRIVAESAEGQGATFIVTLPVTQPRPTSP